jgi:sialidase-1
MNVLLRKSTMTVLNTLLLSIFLLASAHCKKSETAAGAGTISPELKQTHLPLNFGVENTGILEIRLAVSDVEEALALNDIEVSFSADSKFSGIESISAKYSGAVKGADTNLLLGTSKNLARKTNIAINYQLGTGIHFLKFDVGINANPDLTGRFKVEKITLSFKNHESVSVSPTDKYIFRPKMVLRKHGQDKTDTYRIPGLITTNKGTLIAVYDNRYNNSKDLQEDIDIGMSRSTDGGQSWQPMRVIMDMGEYGGRSQRLNGTGDPCVLFDEKTNTIWVAALWMSGATEKDMLWWASKPGMKPEETGQFMVVKSTDDGLTWSQPINLTSQIKDQSWQLLLQGPGRGITMTDGTLVFPAQFKADLGTKALDGGQYTCHSTIVYSKDLGKTWQIGIGAKSNTTEAQVVQLADGSLMLNMRDDRNRADKGATNGRAVAITTDLGKTWTTHSTSNSALLESNCQASIISTELVINGKKQHVLFFSNPNSKTDRSHMTIKASLDSGLTWPEIYQVELNAENGYGYSCMTMVDNQTIGIVYEGVKELYFQKIPVSDILGPLVK